MSHAPLRKLGPVSDWLAQQLANRQVRKLREEYGPKVEAAEKKRDWDERNRLLAEWSFEEDDWLHPIYARQAEKLTAKARRYGISISSHPSDPFQESDDWFISRVCGEWLLRSEAEKRLRREICDEQRGNFDEFRKWATFVFAILGFVLGFASLWMRHKEPDPCPRNYYRNDSGACVFALDKSVQRQLP